MQIKKNFRYIILGPNLAFIVLLYDLKQKNTPFGQEMTRATPSSELILPLLRRVGQPGSTSQAPAPVPPLGWTTACTPHTFYDSRLPRKLQLPCAHITIHTFHIIEIILAVPWFATPCCQRLLIYFQPSFPNKYDTSWNIYCYV